MQLDARRSPLLILHVSGQSLDRSRHVSLLEAYARRAIVVHVEPEVSFAHGVRARFESTAGEVADALGAGRLGKIVRLELPARIPGNRFTAVAAHNRMLALRAFIARVRAAEPRALVMLTCSFPTLLPTLRGLGTDVAVYEARDDYVALRKGESGEQEARRIERAQRDMAAGADLAWAVSAPLVERLRAIRGDVIETSNGVDFAAFTAAPPAGGPAGFVGIGRPRAGIIGNLNDRMNWDWLAALARERPALQVVVVGPVYMAGPDTHAGIERLRAYANAHVLGAVEASEIAPVVHAFDVGLIPYRLFDVTESVNPLKAYQYLAAGKPVVASRIPALAKLSDLVSLCDDEAGFVAAVDRALKDDAPAARERRRARAMENSWERVADARIEAALRFLASTK
jgi:glycosyltransferase involved in cell wall biosynthesis